MKRKGNLIRAIADPDNLRLAFYKARKGKEDRHEVRDFQDHLDDNLVRLREELLRGEVEVGNYRIFLITDPKVRAICAAPFRQRVLHHAIMNVCHELFDNYQTDDSYASRIGKGALAAVRTAKRHQQNYAWALKLDVRKYFDSIDHSVLKSMLRRKIKDGQLLHILDDIIDSYASQSDDGMACGLPIGNLTSQYFANHYLAVLDHKAKEVWGVRAYVRYMDDILIWDNDKERLKRLAKQMADFAKRELHLDFKPAILLPTRVGMNFLGYRVFQHRLWLSTRSKRRYSQKMRQYLTLYRKGTWSQEELQQRLLALSAFVFAADSKHFRQQALLHWGHLDR